MLRVGLTGGLGSGKSTVAARLRALGAEVIEADELGRAMMEPGQPVYSSIVEHFGAEVVSSDGRLDRSRLAEVAFKGGRVNELNAIIHPAVIVAQQRWMEQVFARDPAAVAVVESALIFEVERDARARGESETVLEQNQSKSALDKSLRGGFFLRKKPLEGFASGYTYSGSALAARNGQAARRLGRAVAVQPLRQPPSECGTLGCIWGMKGSGCFHRRACRLAPRRAVRRSTIWRTWWRCTSRGSSGSCWPRCATATPPRP